MQRLPSLDAWDLRLSLPRPSGDSTVSWANHHRFLPVITTTGPLLSPGSIDEANKHADRSSVSSWRATSSRLLKQALISQRSPSSHHLIDSLSTSLYTLHPLNMLFTSLASLLLPALALAAPTKRTYDDDHHDADLLDSGVFEFTSTYVAHASPNEM